MLPSTYNTNLDLFYMQIEQATLSNMHNCAVDSN